MSTPQAIPGDPWVVCDICGFYVRMSQSRKTWDGLRVCPDDWDPKHPLLSIRAKMDRQAVFDARPPTVDRFVNLPHGSYGSFTLISPNGTNYIVYVADDGALIVTPGILGTPVDYLLVGIWKLTVDDDGALHVNLSGEPALYHFWKMVSANDYIYNMRVADDGAVIMEAVT